MNGLLPLVVDIVRFVTAFHTEHSVLQVVQAREVLADLCAGAVAPALLDELAHALVACATDPHAPLPPLEAFEAQLANVHDLDQRVARVKAALNELLALQLMLRQELVVRGHVSMTNATFFAYLHTCNLRPVLDQGALVLVGALPTMAHKLEIPLDKSNRVLQRMSLAYNTASPYPLLDLRMGSSSMRSEWTGQRFDWQHQEGQEHDLRLSLRGTVIGRIMTRLITPPYTCTGQHITMTICDLPAMELRETRVLDASNNVLFTCIRATMVSR